jgi:hypothetical protein
VGTGTAGTIGCDNKSNYATASSLGNYYTKTETNTELAKKQNALTNGQNIKTVNGQNILGSGNLNTGVTSANALTSGKDQNLLIVSTSGDYGTKSWIVTLSDAGNTQKTVAVVTCTWNKANRTWSYKVTPIMSDDPTNYFDKIYVWMHNGTAADMDTIYVKSAGIAVNSRYSVFGIS